MTNICGDICLPQIKTTQIAKPTNSWAKVQWELENIRAYELKV